jgi:hypothetical protein
MKNLYALTVLLLACCLFACQQITTENEPTEGEQEGGSRAYYEMSRRAALGDDWENITKENLERASQDRLFPKEDVFAGGALEGNWYERGGSTVAGSILATYFYPVTEEIYAISETGTLLKGGLTGGAWSILNDVIPFNNKILAILPITGGKRIVTARTDHRVYYSDDEGVSWTLAGGSIANPHNWGAGGKQLIVLNNGILYYLQHVWQGSPWGSGYQLHRSADNGATWTQVQSFGLRNENKVVMWSPFGTNDLYVLDNGTALYSLSGMASTLTLLNNNINIPTNNDYSLSGYKNGSTLNLYVLANSNVLYKSTDNGANWTNTANLTTSAWSVGLLANPWVADALYYGAVDFYKSTAVTPSFTAQNTWSQYYGNIDLLHADMVSITPFQKTDGTKFILIGNHGGIHYYPDPFTTTTNLTKTGIRNADYYDVVTVGGTIFAGSQDQGNQRFSGGSGTNILTASQLISGDYVRVNSSVNGTKYWQEYPSVGTSGTFHYYDSPLTQQFTTAQTQIYGTLRTNMQQWVIPTCNWSNPAENSILVGGGGALAGATTSQVIKLTYNGSSIVKTSYAFDFIANGNGYITALDHSPANANYMYVGLNNGKFYYSHDGGTSWTQTASFTGPSNGWNYGSFIHASRTNPLLAFYCGGGGGICKTTDGGVSFTNMSAGLPNTFVSELTLNTAETLLFAATDAGPYVCVLNTGQWYSLGTANSPVKGFRAVEWLPAQNIARFATYGRGVWDFQVTAQPLPVSYKSFDAKGIDNQYVELNWATEMERDLSHFEVEKSYDGQNFTTMTTVKANNKASQYTISDKLPLFGLPNYYRIKSVELSGKTEWTKIKSVVLSNQLHVVSVYPTLLTKGSLLTIQNEVIDRQFFLFDNQGRVVWQQKLGGQIEQLSLPTLPNGVYHFTIRERSQQVVKTGKLMVL